MKFEFINY